MMGLQPLSTLISSRYLLEESRKAGGMWRQNVTFKTFVTSTVPSLHVTLTLYVNSGSNVASFRICTSRSVPAKMVEAYDLYLRKDGRGGRQRRRYRNKRYNSLFLDLHVPSTIQRHLKTSRTFMIHLHQFKTHVTKSQVCLIHCHYVKIHNVVVYTAWTRLLYCWVELLLIAFKHD